MHSNLRFEQLFEDNSALMTLHSDCDQQRVQSYASQVRPRQLQEVHSVGLQCFRVHQMRDHIRTMMCAVSPVSLSSKAFSNPPVKAMPPIKGKKRQGRCQQERATRQTLEFWTSWHETA